MSFFFISNSTALHLWSFGIIMSPKLTPPLNWAVFKLSPFGHYFRPDYAPESSSSEDEDELPMARVRKATGRFEEDARLRRLRERHQDAEEEEEDRSVLLWSFQGIYSVKVDPVQLTNDIFFLQETVHLLCFLCAIWWYVITKSWKIFGQNIFWHHIVFDSDFFLDVFLLLCEGRTTGQWKVLLCFGMRTFGIKSCMPRLQVIGAMRN